MNRIKYTEIPCTGKFNEVIQNYWKFEISENCEPFIHESMPENTFSVVFINQPYYSGIRILGPQTKKFRQQIHPRSVYIGIRINPWINFENLPGLKNNMVNQTVEVSGTLNGIFMEINPRELSTDFSSFHLIEKGISRLMHDRKILSDPLVKYICLRLYEGIKIRDMAEEIPLSLRPVQKRFKYVTGITMTDYRNILRLRKTIKRIYMGKESLTNAAFEHGFTDHAHYIHSFKKYMDTTSMKDFFRMTDRITLSMDK